MTWAFIWLMVILKIPIIALLTIVWWALRAEPEPAQGSSEDGGLRRAQPRHPRPTHPRRPRRGPHGTPAAVPPPRVRISTLRGRPVEH